MRLRQREIRLAPVCPSESWNSQKGVGKKKPRGALYRLRGHLLWVRRLIYPYNFDEGSFQEERERELSTRDMRTSNDWPANPKITTKNNMLFSLRS